MKLLLIEDDEKFLSALKFQLEKEHYEVDVCRDGEEGLFFIQDRVHDLILLDRMLPGLDGLTVLKETRKAGIETPVILITALGELDDRVSGLDCGADDYIVKPFAFQELMARIRCINRRPSGLKNSEILSYGDLSYQIFDRQLNRGLFSTVLSKREGGLLEFFLRNPGQTLERGVILSRVWGPDSTIEEGNLDNYIHLLRRRLAKVKSSLVIQTVRGVGYCLEDSNV